ncbi:MAG: hypothetical protein FJZ08_00135 [Candidatus Omnitrophica bacterium]|nr:hypothetical protein [Candidatus Omnitrophota bacterium]
MRKIYPRIIKQEVRHLRKCGRSLEEIKRKLNIPKNTLSGWVKDIQLSKIQKQRIKEKIIASGVIGRPLAVKVNREKIEKWKAGIREEVKHFEKYASKDPESGKLICGLLYLCEGAKYPSSRYLYFGNSDPKMVCFFLRSLRRYYNIDENKLRFSISYRYDQNYQKLKTFWSKLIKIPKSKFLKSQPDIRTRCKPTLRKKYYGVGRLIYYDTTLQFELQSIGETIIKNGAGGT